MSYNGSGVYTLPGAALANGATISATENNQFRNDVAAALNVAWTRDGQAPATANIPMGNHKLTGLAAGTGAGDSVRFEQLPSATNKLDLTTSVTGALPVANGGSGAATLTGILKGNGTSAFSAAAAGTDYLAPAAIGTTVQGYAAELQGATQGGINGMKNRIINGDMKIDQRNDGASVTPADGAYTLDRWQTQTVAASGVYTVQRSTVAPSGFTNSLLATVTTVDSSLSSGDYYYIRQKIEGFNTADFGFGAAGAATVTLSFKVRSSVTGTFGGSLANSAFNRSYPFTYTVNSVNTWEDKQVTIAGDTSGTWLTDNGIGINVCFSLGVGSNFSGTAGAWEAAGRLSATGATNLMATNGATFYITGVQLEKGSTATSFDYRPYGTELQLCQRYYQRIGGGTGDFVTSFGCVKNTTNQALVGYQSMVPFRATPTVSFSGSGSFLGGNTSIALGSILGVTTNSQSPIIGVTWAQTATSIPSNYNFAVYLNGNAYFEFPAEL